VIAPLKAEAAEELEVATWTGAYRGFLHENNAIYPQWV
jgi:hypothetical protein